MIFDLMVRFFDPIVKISLCMVLRKKKKNYAWCKLVSSLNQYINKYISMPQQ